MKLNDNNLLTNAANFENQKFYIGDFPPWDNDNHPWINPEITPLEPCRPYVAPVTYYTCNCNCNDKTIKELKEVIDKLLKAIETLVNKK